MPGKTRASKRNGSTRERGRRPGAKALRPNPFLALVDTVRKEVDTRLAGLLDAKLDAALEQDAEVLEMVRAFRDLCLRGGKRLRAALLVAGYRAANATADTPYSVSYGAIRSVVRYRYGCVNRRPISRSGAFQAAPPGW